MNTNTDINLINTNIILTDEDLINHAFNYVLIATKQYSIDESHAIKHSMDVYKFAKDIYKDELTNNPHISKQYRIICLSAILHDMCDKKYMNEEEGLNNIKIYLKSYVDIDEIDIIVQIISTMSYSTVKKNSYPKMEDYQLAYHIVREADLLAAYDIDRCIIYGLTIEKLSYNDAIIRGRELFTNRVLRYIDDNLFITEYGKKLSKELHQIALKKLEDI